MLRFDPYICKYNNVDPYCYEPGVTRKKWKSNQQQALNY